MLPTIYNPKFIFGLYIVVAIITAISKYVRGPQDINNYLIFKNVFWNTFHQLPLFDSYPEAYFDTNHYGIFFSVLIAPFALLPDWLGISLWNVANALVFLYAIYTLPFSYSKKALFAILCIQEYITAAISLQFNIALVGLLILSAVYINKNKENQSVIAILIGFFVKIYGIVGLSQFFFIKNKVKFVVSGLVISILFFVLPMIFTSPDFVLQSYIDWMHSLIEKNGMNQALDSRQDYTIMGIVRRVLGDASLPNGWFFGFGIPLFFLPYIRIKQYQNTGFRLSILSSSLLFLVLFSSGSESPTYIIAVAGVMLWFLMKEKPSTLVWFLLVFVIILTCFSQSDLFPKAIREKFIIKYALKALPCFLVWLKLIWELMTEDFSKNKSFIEEP